MPHPSTAPPFESSSKEAPLRKKPKQKKWGPFQAQGRLWGRQVGSRCRQQVYARIFSMALVM